MIWENGSFIDPNEHDLSKLEFICESLPSGKMTDYAVSDMGCPVMSQRLKDHLDNLGIDNIQYFEASIIEREGEDPKSGYYAANIIGLIDCIDRNSSEMDAETDDEDELTIIYGIDKLVLNDVFSSNHTLFRAAYFTRIIVSDNLLYDKLYDSDVVGIRFVRPERWDGINGEL